MSRRPQPRSRKNRDEKLIVLPEDGLEPLLTAINKAQKSIDLTIFRLDRKEIETALTTAVRNGVRVRALIASFSRGGEKKLRKLEQRLLAAGVIVARTGNDLVRYHDKFLIIDGRWLHLLSFNYTRLDIEHSRGFGIATSNAKLVREGIKLFEADCARQPYVPSVGTFVVSPGSRKALGDLLKRATKQLLIYDPDISDREMIRILRQRARAGVEVKIIGRIGKGANLPVTALRGKVLHTRTIICDRRQAFIGSQSLRPAELDSRRELGLILRHAGVVKRLVATFHEDWASGRRHTPRANRAVAAVVKQLEPLTATVKDAVKEVVANVGEVALEDKNVKDELKTTVKDAVKKAVKQAVDEVVEDAKEPHVPV